MCARLFYNLIAFGRVYNKKTACMQTVLFICISQAHDQIRLISASATHAITILNAENMKTP